MASKIFISYSHDSDLHRDRVWELCAKLRNDGINCIIDQQLFSPPEGWPRWCRNQVQEAKFVLAVCTKTYRRRYEGKEKPGKGLGAGWEGSAITQKLYEKGGRNEKFIPVVFEPTDVRHIPSELAVATHYNASTAEGYERASFAT